MGHPEQQPHLRVHGIRPVLRDVASARTNWVIDHYPSQGTLAGMPEIPDEKFPQSKFSNSALARIDRYADVTELALAMPYVIEGDGRKARFKDFQLLEREKGENPYRQFRRSIQNTFQRGWKQFETDVEAVHPGMLEQIRTRHADLLEKDPTSKHTGRPINYEVFRNGVELGTEMAYYAMTVGLAIDNTVKETTKPNEPNLLATSTQTPEQRLELAYELMRILHARSTDNLQLIFWRKTGNRETTDWNSLRLVDRGNGHFLFNQRGGLFRDYNPQTDPAISDPTIGCMGLLFKINPEEDTHWALDNAMYAAVNQAGELDLFKPETARAAWDSREALLKTHDIETIYRSLPEDLNKLKGKPELRRFATFMEDHFI